MSADTYVQQGMDVHAAIVARVESVVRPPDPPLPAPPSRKGLVLNRDPVNLENQEAWLAALLSPDDLDDENDKRVHAWVVTFGGAISPQIQTRAVGFTFVFPVQVFYSHDSGTAADNSEKRLREEILRVQYALAEVPNFDHMAGIGMHRHLPMRVRLKRWGNGGRVIHHGQGEIEVEIQPFVAYTG